MQLKENIDINFNKFEDIIKDRALDLDFDIICDDNLGKLQGPWAVRTYRFGNHLLALNVKGKGFGDFEKINKGGRFSSLGYDQENYYDYNQSNNELFFKDWEEKFLDKFNLSLCVAGRSGGWWGFTTEDLKDNFNEIFQLNEENIRNIFNSKYPTLLKDVEEFDSDYDDEELADEIFDELSGEELAKLVEFKPEFITMCDEFSESVATTSDLMEGDDYNDEAFENITQYD